MAIDIIPASGAAAAKVVQEHSWTARWWRLLELRVGFIPVPVFLILIGVAALFLAEGKLPAEASVAAGVLAAGGCLCAEIGRRIPIVRHIGGAIIFTTFVPAGLAYYGWLPAELQTYVSNFTNSTKVLYVFIALICVGSILSMDRTILLRGFLKIFLPLAIGSLVAAVVGVSVGSALGLGAKYTFFYIVIPIMAGGIGEGAIPLSIGYSGVLGTAQATEFAQVLPPVMFGSLSAVAMAGLLNFVGKRHPRLTGEGRLQPGENNLEAQVTSAAGTPLDATEIGAAAISVIALYLLGLVCYDLFGLPAPVSMLFIAVLVKLAHGASPSLQQGSVFVYKFASSVLTFPMLFAVGLSFMPWRELMAALAWKNLLTIICTVAALIGSGFVAGRWVGLYPIEAAIVNACHSGQGSSGDVAILTAANRLQLMPFAQIATRIGGAITVTLALIALARLR